MIVKKFREKAVPHQYEIEMSDDFSAAATDVLALDATDVFSADTTDVMFAAKAADGTREAKGRA